MHSIRKWFYRPKKEDSSKLAIFYWADEELTLVAAELDSFDGRTDPDRCSILVGQLRMCQDKVLGICNDIMDEAIPDMRANRDFRAKFPDDILHENLAGQLWFGAECLAAGSNIIYREVESASMRPLAKALTRSLENVRCLLREQSLKNLVIYSDKVREALRIFDRLFADFELCYVSAMVPIKSAKEYHLQQEIVVLFSETLIRALKIGLVTQDMIDDCDPSLMFTIPRLAIVWGLLLYPDGPFNVERDSADLSELFRPFCNLLFKIRDLLWTLTETELHALEKMLCSQEEPDIDDKAVNLNERNSPGAADDSSIKHHQSHISCKQFIADFYAYNFGVAAPRLRSSTENSESIESPDDDHCSSLQDSNQNNLEFEMEFQKACDRMRNSELLQEERSAAIRNQDCNDNYCNQTRGDHLVFREDNRNRAVKEFEEWICDEDDQSCLPCQQLPRPGLLNPQSLMPGNCSCGQMDGTTNFLEGRLSRLHDDCTCGVDSSSRERLTPSRQIMQQVMGRVHIVAPGQQLANFSSSVDNSPRAYHHGLMSRSFPAHPASDHSGRPRRDSSSKHRKSTKSSKHRRRSHRSDGSNKGYNFSNAPSRFVGSWCSSPLSSPLTIPRVRQLKQGEDGGSESSDATYSSCSSCQSVSSVSSPEWDSTSPDTSSYNSECQDDEEIAFALQAAEIASRNKARSRFKNSRDLLHKLFVCVSGVADQLQTNCASDLRNILKSVFDMNSVHVEPPPDNTNSNLNGNLSERTDHPLLGESIFGNGNVDESILNNNGEADDERDASSVDSAEEVVAEDGISTQSLQDFMSENGNEPNSLGSDLQSYLGPPAWMPDELSSNCMACKIQFTILRRRHHCRNCGKIFCSRCSSNSIPLPRFGHLKPVRVCNQCFMYQLANLVMHRQL